MSMSKPRNLAALRLKPPSLGTTAVGNVDSLIIHDDGAVTVAARVRPTPSGRNPALVSQHANAGR